MRDSTFTFCQALLKKAILHLKRPSVQESVSQSVNSKRLGQEKDNFCEQYLNISNMKKNYASFSYD